MFVIRLDLSARIGCTIIASVSGRPVSIIEALGTRDAAPLRCEHAAKSTQLGCPLGTVEVSRRGPDDPPTEPANGVPAVTERALTLVLQRAAAAYDTDGRWELRVRAALSALLALFDERPDLARLCVVESENADPTVVAVRQQILAVLASRIDDGRNSARRPPPPHAAHAVLAGAVGAIRGRLLESDPATVSDLLDPLMSFIVLPYRGAAASRGELTPRVPLS